MSKRPEVIIVHESIAESWARDASSVVGFILLIGIGVYLESNAMQWVGAIIGFVTIVSLAMKRDNRLSVSEARKRLDEIEARQ